MQEVILKQVEIAGAKLRTRQRGEGEPVLLTHGVPGDLETLAPVADRLSRRHRAITVSLRYADPGSHGERPFGTGSQRDDLRDLIPALNTGPVHLVAWSYSAHAALVVAAACPDLVLSLFVYEPGFPTFVTDKDEIGLVQEDMMRAFGPVFEAMSEDDRALALRLSIDAAAGTPGWFAAQPERVRQIHERTAHMLPLLLTQTPPIEIAASDLRAIRCPATVCWGRNTRACYRIVSEHASRAIPDARVSVIERAGHLFPESHPEAFAREIEAHLAWAATRTASER